MAINELHANAKTRRPNSIKSSCLKKTNDLKFMHDHILGNEKKIYQLDIERQNSNCFHNQQHRIYQHHLALNETCGQLISLRV